MPTISERVATATDTLEADVQIRHDITHGPATGTGSTVDTDNGAVKTMAAAIRTLLLANPRGAWLTGTAYALKDTVTQSSVVYICQVAHTSGTFATDLAAGKWAVHQGATLEDLAAASGATLVSYSPTGTGAVARALATLLRERPISVKDFGAVGDGVADDTTAFTNAIAAANAAAISGNVSTSTFGGEVYAPHGLYRITSALSFPNGVGLRGAGRKTTQIIVDGNTSTDGLKWESATQYGLGGYLRDIDIACSAYSKCRDLVRVVRWSSFEMANVRIAGAGRYGLYTLDGIDCTFTSVKIESSQVTACYMDQGASIATTQRFFGCYFANSTTAPNVYVKNIIGLVLDACVFESAGGTTPSGAYGFHLASGEATLINPYFENNADSDIKAGTTANAYLTVMNGSTRTGPYTLAVASIAVDYSAGLNILGGKWSVRTKSLTMTANTTNVNIAGGNFFPVPERTGGTLRQVGGTMFFQDPGSGNPLCTGATVIQAQSSDVQTSAPGTTLVRSVSKIATGSNANILREDWSMKDSAGNDTVFFRVEVGSSVITDGSESTNVDFFILAAGTLVRALRLRGNQGVVVNAEQNNVSELLVKGASVDLISTTVASNALAFFGATPIAKPTVTGSRGGNAALASLCTALANLGLITNSTS